MGTQLIPTMKTIILAIGLISIIASCQNPPSGTPSEFKIKSNYDSVTYKKDSVEIESILRKMLSKHMNPFQPLKQFDSNTKIYLDSIIYSPDRLRMVAFVITKNSTDKLLKRENNALFFYKANYLFCSRNSKFSPITVYDYTGFNLAYYYDYDDIKKRLNEYCFFEMAGQGGYNLDDIRFWQSDRFARIIKNASPTQR